MVPRIGIIAPWEWTGRFNHIASSFPRMVFKFLGYRENHEIPDILRRCRNEVDGILFCGETPERIGSPHVPAGFPVALIRYDLHSVMRTLYEIMRDHPSALEHGVTIDTLSANDIKELCAELQINPKVIQSKNFLGIAEVDDVVGFHTEHYESGRVKALATGMQAAHRVLLARGLPSYYVRPTDAILRDGLQRIASAVHYSRSANAQVAVLLIEVVSFDHRSSAAPEAGKVTDCEAELYALLHRTTAAAKCSLTVAGTGSYVVFATRSSLLALAGESLDLPFILETSHKFGATLNVGIGLGLTTAEAHDHARTGLLSARRAGEGAVYVVHADGALTGPIYSPTGAGMRAAPDSRCTDIARLARISVPMVATLIRWAQINNCTYVTAADLSNVLHVTPRTARRVLTALCDQDLAKIVSEEREGIVGRPRYVYELALSSLSTPPHCL